MNTVFILAVILFFTLAAIITFALLVAVVRAGPHNYQETNRLQEDMTWDKETNEVYSNNRLSDDYLKNLLKP